MKIKSILYRSIIAVVLLKCLSCNKEPCFDIPKIDEYIEFTKSWFVNENIGNTTFIDSKGISQTLVKQESYYTSEKFIEDDCGISYDYFNHSSQYLTSLSSIHFMVDIGGATFDSAGFFIRLGVTNINKSYKSIEYDFYTEKVRNNNANVSFLPKIQVGAREFNDVLEIDLIKTSFLNDVKSVYYARGYGIIMFTQANGNIHQIN